MFLFRLLVTTASVAALANAPAFGDSLPARLRGTITAIDEGGITLNERDGRRFRLGTEAGTTYAEVVPSNLDEIKVNDYIGSAVKGPRDHLIAVEIVLVPEKMRPGRIGYYAWDPRPDTSGIQTSGRSTISAGSIVVVWTEPGNLARLIAVGKGVTPPM